MRSAFYSVLHVKCATVALFYVVLLLMFSSSHRKCDDFNSGLANKHQHRRQLEGWSRICSLSHTITYNYTVVLCITSCWKYTCFCHATRYLVPQVCLVFIE